MVAGNGLIAKGFMPYYGEDHRFLIFASGVSNSGNADPAAFERETALLKKTMAAYPDKILVYFSTCSIYDSTLTHSPYVQHKLAMEALVKQQAAYYIFRISNLAGKTDNPHTFVNDFVQHILAGSFFYLWTNAWRNVLDIDDMVAICHSILQSGLFKNEIVNIANPVNYPVPEIVEVIETVTGCKGNYTLVEKTSIPHIDTAAVQQIAQQLGIRFSEDYLYNIIYKYFAQQ